MGARRGRLVSRRHHGQPGQPVGIIFAGRERVERPFKPITGDWKLRLKFFGDFLADFIAALADARAEPCDHLFRAGAELHLHSPDSFFRNAAKRAAPSGMDGGDGTMFRIGEKNRNAIRRLHNEKHAALPREERISLWRFTGAINTTIDAMHYVGMYLSQRNDAHLARSDSAEKFLAILEDARASVPVREAKIQDTFGLLAATAESLEFTDATWPRAESVDEPIETGERRRFDEP
jgi:hypothetical protein